MILRNLGSVDPIFELKWNHGMGRNPARSVRGGHRLNPDLVLH
jgi:hypothetical protein